MVSGQLPFKGEVEAAVMYSIVNEEPEPLTGLRTGVPIELDHLVTKVLAKSPDERYQHVEELIVDLRAVRKQLQSGGPKKRPPKEKETPLPAEVSVGQMLAHYRLEAKLSEGGMGVVYRALDTHLDRPVAIKVLRAQAVADEERKKRFVQEAKAASALNHPNIITIYDINTANGVDFIAMEYVEGKTLDGVMGRKGLALGETLKYAVQISDALAKAHGEGIVHRDIKPGNIMVTADGLVKVLDFGLAKLTEEGSGVARASLLARPSMREEAPETEEGAILGTVAYMSPEQAEGKPVDARSDIFSFGSVLYEMLTGRRPFAGETKMSVLAAILREEPKLASEVVEGLPREVERIVNRCLRKEPRRRFQHMDDLMVALEELKEESDSGKLRAGPTPLMPVRGWSPAAQISIAFVLLVAVAGASWWLGQSGSSDREVPQKSVLASLTSDSGLTYQPSLSPDGKLLAYASDRGGEGNLDIWVQQVGGGQPVRLTRHEADESEPHFSPDSTKIVFRSERDGRGVYTISTLGGDEPRLIARDGRRPRFSPDGSRIAYWVGSEHNLGGRVRVVGSTGGEPAELARGRSPIWTPDSRHLLFLGRVDSTSEADWLVVSIEGAVVPTGASEALHNQSLGPTVGDSFIADVWRPRENYVAFAARLGDSTNMWEVPISPGAWRVAGPARQLTFGAGIEVQSSFAAGDRMVFSTQVENLDIWGLPIDANRGEVSGDIERLTTSTADDRSPSLSSDGKKMAFLSTRSGNFDLWMKDIETGRESNLTASPEDEGRPIISADGSKVAYRGGPARDIYVVPASGGMARNVCEGCGGALSHWSRSGERLILFGRAPPETGFRRQVAMLTLSSSEVTGLAVDELPLADPRFSPDGNWFAFHTLSAARDRRQVFIAPVRTADLPIKRDEWIAVTDGSGSDGRVAWSPDGNLLYFLSDRDGFRCIWAQSLDPEAKKPVGSAFGVYHAHQRRRSMMNVNPGAISLSVARDKLAISMREITGNIWMMEPASEK